MRIIIAALALIAIASTSAPAAEPQGSRCMSIPPFCPYGQSPLCVCQDDYSYNCIWMCASTR
ncbi:MAG: hypothetical protein ACO3VH_07205 [Ilumatobacteraceae bacterium]